MSQSRRQTTIHGITKCASEKQDKQLAHRRIRRANHVACAIQWDAIECWYHDLIFPHERELSDPWLFGKDGKGWFPPDASYAQQLMRK